MADRAGGRRPAGQDLGASSPDRIRNVVLVGPGGSGKTTLVETLLASAGAIPRAGSITEGSTVCDFEDFEQTHERSIQLSIAPVVHRHTKINFVDTPGYADFVGEVRAGLRAADCALFVIGANEPVDDATTALWRECAEVGMPRAVVITKLDNARADYDGVLAAAQTAFGDKVLPLYVPVRDGDEVTGLLDLMAGPMAEGADHEDLRGALIEGIIEESEDESLMDRYLGGEEISHEVLTEDLEKAVARASFHPVVPVCSVTGIGCTELLDLAVDGFPSPLEHPSPDVFTPAGVAAEGIDVRPQGHPGRRGREDRERPLRRAGQPGAGLLRHPHPRRAGARVRALHLLLRRLDPRGPRRGREGRLARLPVRPPARRRRGRRRRRPGARSAS